MPVDFLAYSQEPRVSTTLGLRVDHAMASCIHRTLPQGTLLAEIMQPRGDLKRLTEIGSERDLACNFPRLLDDHVGMGVERLSFASNRKIARGVRSTAIDLDSNLVACFVFVAGRRRATELDPPPTFEIGVS